MNGNSPQKSTIVSSLTDEEVQSIGHDPKLNLLSKEEIFVATKRKVADTAAQRAFEEFKLIAAEREAKLAKVAFNALKGFYGNLSAVAVIDVYKEAGIEELK